jgi:nitrite reductase/ring-hydroxylating ferredoxin subunit
VDPGSLRKVIGSAWPNSYEATADGRPLALFRCGPAVLAVGRYCPHKGADLAKRGLPDADRAVLVCLAHAHTYRLVDGACLKDDSCEPLPLFHVASGAADSAVPCPIPEV